MPVTVPQVRSKKNSDRGPEVNSKEYEKTLAVKTKNSAHKSAVVFDFLAANFTVQGKFLCIQQDQKA